MQRWLRLHVCVCVLIYYPPAVEFGGLECTLGEYPLNYWFARMGDLYKQAGWVSEL
jgi:hypothetical protein